MGMFDHIPVETHGMSEWTLLVGIMGAIAILFRDKLYTDRFAKQEAATEQQDKEIRELRENNIAIFTTVKSINEKIDAIFTESQRLNAEFMKYILKNK